MHPKNKKGQAMTQPEVEIVREFDVPRQMLWQAWTDPELLKCWISPTGFSVPEYRLDLRVGGRLHFCMRSPDGQDTWATGVYREIVPGEKLVATDSFADAEGNEVPPSYYHMPGEWPAGELLLTLTFEDAPGGKSRLRLLHSGIPAGDMQTGTRQGWQESFDKLDACLADTKGG
jgi:uncharacterized protein YndB with AHSA1/START domain